MFSPQTSTDQPPRDGVPREPDPGSRSMAKLAWILLIVFTASVVALQQMRAGESPTGPKPGDPLSIVEPEPDSAFAMTARMMTRVMTAANDMVAASVPPGQPNPQAAQFKSNNEMAAREVKTVAKTPPERLRSAIVAAQLGMPDDARSQLEALAADLMPNDAEGLPPTINATDEVRAQLLGDIATTTALIDKQDVAADKSDALIARHGWFGKLATTLHAPASDPQRATLVSGGVQMLLLLFALVLVAVAVFLASLVCFVIWLVRLSSGREQPAFTPPAPGGSVYLETVVVFVAAFLALRILTSILPPLLFAKGQEPAWLEAAVIATQWLILPTIFYPLLRGVSWSRWKADLGWHTGRGLFREIGAGIYHYFAGLPIFFAAILLTLVIIAIRGLISGQPNESPHNPILDIVQNSDFFTIVMLYLLASIWAPIVEESIFRGGFFRHLRSTWGVFAAAVLSSLVFGVMHGYEWLMLGPVIGLGFVFALMRNRRDSLVGCVAAHALHNGVLLIFVLSFLSLAGE